MRVVNTFKLVSAHVLLLLQTFSEKTHLNVVKDGVIQALSVASNQSGKVTLPQPTLQLQTATPKQGSTSSSVLMAKTSAGMLPESHQDKEGCVAIFSSNKAQLLSSFRTV